jgi:hypothetical protein
MSQQLTTVFRFILWTLGALALFLAALLLWLRYEFARVSTPSVDSPDWQSVSVGTLLAPRQEQPCRNHYPHRRALFGALHVHTAASYDAAAFGSTTTAAQAYRFARGEPRPLQLRGDPRAYAAPVLRIDRPLDFMAVTDHAEGLGENRLCYQSGSSAHGTLVCRLYRGEIPLPVSDDMQPILRLASLAIFGQDRSARICGRDGRGCDQQAALAWADNQHATEAHHDYSGDCQFTTFHAYEYSLAEASSNLHRNVIFANAAVPRLPAGAKEAASPEALWRWLDNTCISGDDSCNALTIPHNSNWSSGRMWFPYSSRPLEAQLRVDQARLRSRLEPVAEIMQTKGDSECRNGIASVFGAPDEFCDFEKLRPAGESIDDCGESMGEGGMLLSGCVSRYSYLRYALAAGIGERARLGINPFEFGIVAASDSHNGAPAANSERNYLGSHGTDRDLRRRLRTALQVPGDIARGSPVRYNPGGVAGVYAEENSRSSIFAALGRREVFGTSGPRIEPRFFALTTAIELDCSSPDLLAQAYEHGVPMGSTLDASSVKATSPSFLVTASADPGDDALPLQRIQVVKVWLDRQGATHQAVFDVAGDPDNGAAVDPDTCETEGQGFRQLCASWRDPEFDPDTSAVYYARVLENPSCRWSRHDCLRLPAVQRPASCSDPDLPWQVQERAWTSPIWYYADG